MTNSSDWRPPPGSGTFKAKMRQVACRQCGGRLEESYNYCPICGIATLRHEVDELFKEYLTDTPEQTPENDSTKDDS